MIILKKILKVVLLPVSLLLLLIKVIFKFAERASEIVIGLLILLVGSGIVYSLIMHQWKNLLIFAIVGGGIIAAMFMCVVVEAGLIDSSKQVGQTGKTVMPKVYIACGISGAIQHIEGMKGAGTIIAINNDKDAPIFNIADYGIVGDINDILPKLLEKEL